MGDTGQGLLFEEIWGCIERDPTDHSAIERACTRFEQRLLNAEKQLNQATNELHCCDDISLDKGLAVGISELQVHRETLEQRLADAEKERDHLKAVLTEIQQGQSV